MSTESHLCKDCGMRLVQCDVCMKCSACCDCEDDLNFFIKAFDALGDIDAMNKIASREKERKTRRRE